jgi:5'-nucleotidase
MQNSYFFLAGLSEGIRSLAMGNSESGPLTELTILHFNDVYNIEPRDLEPVGGAARFTSAIKQRAHLNPLVLFSGDAFNPSLSEF